MWRKEYLLEGRLTVEIKIIGNEEETKVIPVDDVDMTTSVELREALQKLLRRKTKKIIVSLEKVNYIDSSGLATLIECHQECNKYKGSMTLLIDNPKIMDVFKLARLDRVFDIANTKVES